MLIHEGLELLPRDQCIGYLQRGGWGVFRPDEPVPLRQWRDDEIAFEEVDERGLREREPALRPGPRRTIFFPALAQVRNPRHLKALIAWCGLKGVRLQAGCPVYGFERTGGRITAVRTARGPLSAGKFLLATGAWTDGLLEGIGWRPGIRPIRGQIALLHPQSPLLGRVVEEAPTETLFLAPEHPYSRALLSSILEPSLEELPPRVELQGEDADD